MAFSIRKALMGCRPLQPIIEIIFNNRLWVSLAECVACKKRLRVSAGVGEGLIIDLLPWQSILLKYWFG